MAVRDVPYRSQPRTAFWRDSISKPHVSEVDPVVDFGLKITRSMRIATAGSCFAQHIARHLSKSGFNYFVTEEGHPIIADEAKKAYNYGTFSARYGNVYTSRQLVQLFKRAYGSFSPKEPVWRLEQEGYIDPFRPNIQPQGFVTEQELLLDREAHLRAVRRCFEQSDVFVFTLGLTEAWISKEDGAVFPVCPGVKGGSFDDDRYEFINLSHEEVVKDMDEFVDLLGGVNPDCQIIITVSPVPLIATATDRHVLAATTYSKSVLRVVAEDLIKKHSNVHYFPSYEIITGAHARGRYFGPDLREVEEAGVDHVMRLFFKHAVNASEIDIPAPRAVVDDEKAYAEKVSNIVTAICDEELLDAAVQ